MNATLRVLNKADKEIQKLPRIIKGAIYEFQHKFRQNPDAQGLHFKRLQGDSRLFSAYVTHDYRALLLHAGGQDYILVAVRHRKDVYENLDRYSYQINPVSGGIEFVDLVAAESGISAPDRAAAVKPEARELEQPRPLFAAYTVEQLRDLGVAGPLLPLVVKLTSEEELLGLVEYAPTLTEDILLGLYDGKTYQEVLDHVTAPVKAEEPVDAEDYASALIRPTTQVTTEDTELQSVLDDEFGQWKIFLHPAQRKLVERDYSGPARVSGGPGTGKTIVALHRVKHLVERLSPGHDRPVLFTTFNKNLATDLRKRLLELGGKEIVDRVDIVNIDKLATQVVSEGEHGGRRRRLEDRKAIQEWHDLLVELGETRWDADFLYAEWSHVILGQAINSRTEYFRARRAGRGRNIGRTQRAEIWQLVEKYVMRLDEKNLWTYRQVAERAARIQMERAAEIESYQEDRAERGEMIHRADQSRAWLRYRYRHIVVDEAQDLGAAHWKMLRAMVEPGPSDLFLVGDTHQRIYDNYVSLRSLGIDIRGRSSRLTLSYRTTHEILGTALALLGTESWDDLDEGTDDLAGYRSVLRGPRPELRPTATWEAEQDAIVEQVATWIDGDASPSIAICVPERGQVEDVEGRLARAGIPAATIGPDGPKLDNVVHIGTMHRFKGLEYRYMVIAGVADGAVPQAYLSRYRNTDPQRYRRELQRSRSLLFVAATRARDALVISWHGKPSPFIRE